MPTKKRNENISLDFVFLEVQSKYSINGEKKIEWVWSEIDFDDFWNIFTLFSPY